MPYSCLVLSGMTVMGWREREKFAQTEGHFTSSVESSGFNGDPLHSQGPDTLPFFSPSLSFLTSPIACFLGLLLLLEKLRFKPSFLLALILSQTRISVSHASTPATIFEHPSLSPLSAHKSIPRKASKNVSLTFCFHLLT